MPAGDMESLSVRYAKSKGSHIAYAVRGDGPPDVLFLMERIVEWELFAVTAP